MSAAIKSNAITWTSVILGERPTDAGFSISVNTSILARWIDRENDLKAIRRYRDNWDGFGSPAPDPILLDVAIRFLLELRHQDATHPPFRVALSPDATICFEWQSTGYYLEAEITSHDRVEWMEAIQGQNPKHSAEHLSGRLATKARSDAWDGESEIATGAAVFVSGR